MHSRTSLCAVVVADTSCVDVLVPVAGSPLLVRAVEGLLGAGGITHVHVVLPDGIEPRSVVDACARLPVAIHPHVLQRRADAEGDAGNDPRMICPDAEAVVVHDAARGLAPSTLARAVLARLRMGEHAVVPVLPLTDTVKEIGAGGLVRGTPARAQLRVVQTPQAFRVDVLLAYPDVPLLRLATTAAAHGVVVRTVAGDPMAFAVRSTLDVELAGLLQDKAIDA